MIIFLYLNIIKVNVITLFNSLGILVSYNVFLRKLKSITISSSIFIKAQAFNHNFVDMLNNFKYRENVTGRRMSNIIKFRLVTIVL